MRVWGRLLAGAIVGAWAITILVVVGTLYFWGLPL